MISNFKKIPSLWTKSYFCGTVGDACEETVKKSIANQQIECTFRSFTYPGLKAMGLRFSGYN
ncbi:transposase [Planktothrix mougeotii LEGE 06226]|uniref:Transposase n=1 Tax=Planktothrix mougeotii LEGE 06226 TaxID=1828728 RepID=A0ABR9UJZ7_9CYAN|nr:transposase [Planktothrix mougeotii LEGE 06226]